MDARWLSLIVLLVVVVLVVVVVVVLVVLVVIVGWQTATLLLRHARIHVGLHRRRSGAAPAPT